MRQYITSEINKLAHQIHQEFELPWGIAFRLTLRLKTTPYDDVLSPTSVFGNWMPSNTLRLAGHFGAYLKDMLKSSTRADLSQCRESRISSTLHMNVRGDSAFLS